MTECRCERVLQIKSWWQGLNLFGQKLPVVLAFILSVALLFHVYFEVKVLSMIWKNPIQVIIQAIISDGVRNLSLLLAASIGWFFLYWRAKTTDLNAEAAKLSAEATRKNAKIAEQGLTVDRLIRAIEQLANKEDSFVRLGGILGLEEIAKAQAGEHKKITRILVSFIRGQATKGSGIERQDPIAYRTQRLDIEYAILALANITSDLEKRGYFSEENKKIQLCDLQDTDLRGLRFDNANLSNFNFACADMSATCLVDTNLSKACFYKPHTQKGANLKNANLERANFSKAHLKFVNFSGVEHAKKANFIGADLRHADFTETVFNEVEFKLALLNEADLTDAYWSNMPDIQQYQIDKAFRCKEHDTTIISTENGGLIPPPEIEKVK